MNIIMSWQRSTGRKLRNWLVMFMLRSIRLYGTHPKLRTVATELASTTVRVTPLSLIVRNIYFCQNRAEVRGGWLALRAFQRWAGRLWGMPRSISAASPRADQTTLLGALQNHNSDCKAVKTMFFEHSE